MKSTEETQNAKWDTCNDNVCMNSSSIADLNANSALTKQEATQNKKKLRNLINI